jgi:hypothetical protein
MDDTVGVVIGEKVYPGNVETGNCGDGVIVPVGDKKSNVCA